MDSKSKIAKFERTYRVKQVMRFLETKFSYYNYLNYSPFCLGMVGSFVLVVFGFFLQFQVQLEVESEQCWPSVYTTIIQNPNNFSDKIELKIGQIQFSIQFFLFFSFKKHYSASTNRREPTRYRYNVQTTFIHGSPSVYTTIIQNRPCIKRSINFQFKKRVKNWFLPLFLIQFNFQFKIEIEKLKIDSIFNFQCLKKKLKIEQISIFYLRF